MLSNMQKENAGGTFGSDNTGPLLFQPLLFIEASDATKARLSVADCNVRKGFID